MPPPNRTKGFAVEPHPSWIGWRCRTCGLTSTELARRLDRSEAWTTALLQGTVDLRLESDDFLDRLGALIGLLPEVLPNVVRHP